MRYSPPVLIIILVEGYRHLWIYGYVWSKNADCVVNILYVIHVVVATSLLFCQAKQSFCDELLESVKQIILFLHKHVWKYVKYVWNVISWIL